MKRIIVNAITAIGITTAALAQPEPPPNAPDAATRVHEHRLREARELVAANDPSILPTFDLDFPGGTPHQLVDAIRKQIGKLNAIIPTEHKDVRLPPLKLQNVNVKQLFEALDAASMKIVPYVTGEVSGRRMINERATTMAFRASSPITAESIWYFQVTNPPQGIPEPKVVRYYQLKPYLGEYNIDDITTAIQAGWKMLGEGGDLPNLNFHQETSLLIAVGASSQLAMIDSVLQQLHLGIPPRETISRVRSQSGSPVEPTPTPAK